MKLVLYVAVKPKVSKEWKNASVINIQSNFITKYTCINVVLIFVIILTLYTYTFFLNKNLLLIMYTL